MTWRRVEIAGEAAVRGEASAAGSLILLDLKEVEDFELLNKTSSQSAARESALALANARAGLSSIQYGACAYHLQLLKDGGALLVRDNRTYVGKLIDLKNPVLVCQ